MSETTPKIPEYLDTTLKEGDIVQFMDNPEEIGVVEKCDGKIYVWYQPSPNVGERCNPLGWVKIPLVEA